MIFSFIRTSAQHRYRITRGVPHELSPHVMRDIGLDPRSERHRFPFHPLW